MKQFSVLTIALIAGFLASSIAFAGPEPVQSSDKEMKQVAPAPSEWCNWTGFYVGINAGGQFGHSETKDLDDYWFPDRPWGYSESSFSGGGQVGYNYQWNRFVVGAEGDGGWMDLRGHGMEPGTDDPGSGPNFGHSSSDFFTTLRGRVGFLFGPSRCWMVYGTGGAIGVNFETRDYDPAENLFGGRQDFDWGYTVGGGLEWKFARHWSVKAEYLYYSLDSQHFNGVWPGHGTFGFNGENMGNIVRAGLNFHF